MRPLASIYSHRVPGFMETQVGFNPKQIRILKGNSSRVCRSTGRSTDPCHGRPAQSSAPTREQSHYSRSTGAGRPLLPVHARARRSTGLLHRSTGRLTGSTSGLLHAPFLAPLSSDLCATFFHLFHLLSHIFFSKITPITSLSARAQPATLILSVTSATNN